MRSYTINQQSGPEKIMERHYNLTHIAAMWVNGIVMGTVYLVKIFP